MELEEALLKRRSIRKYNADDISDEIINKLMHAAMSGPSACNKKPWEFYVIKDEVILEKLRHCNRYCNINGKIAIVACGSLKKALPRFLSDYWIEDVSAATENILLMATSLNLGSLWCGIYPQKEAVKKVQEVLNLDDNIIPLNIIYIGYTDEKVEARDQYDESCVHIIK